MPLGRAAPAYADYVSFSVAMGPIDLKDSHNLLWRFDLLPITYFNFSAVLDHCEDSFCSEKEVVYSAPMPQLKLLLEKSPSCVQEVKFDCQLAPIVVSFIL